MMILSSIHPAIIIGIPVLLVILASVIAFPIFFPFIVGKIVYKSTLVRFRRQSWGYSCSDKSNPEQVAMWDEAVLWSKENAHRMKEVSITSADGLYLHGEFYDFQSESCVIILPGRCESLRYSCYFAKPYVDMGFSVLVIDQRCHGKSEGKYSTVGYMEGIDAAAWADYLMKNHNIKSIWLHGICIGSAGAFVCATREDRRDRIKGVVAEGPYVTFRETFKQHLIAGKHPVHPALDIVMKSIKKNTGVDQQDAAPIDLVPKLSCHVLYLFGKEDIFSVPEKSKQLIEATKSPTMKAVWFEKGSHSHLRINNKEAYDNAIKDYISSL